MIQINFMTTLKIQRSRLLGLTSGRTLRNIVDVYQGGHFHVNALEFSLSNQIVV